MLSSLLTSQRAIMVNIQIMRAFVQLRRLLLTNRDFKRKIELIEREYDKQFSIVFQAMKQLLAPPSVKQNHRLVLVFKMMNEYPALYGKQGPSKNLTGFLFEIK